MGSPASAADRPRSGALRPPTTPPSPQRAARVRRMEGGTLAPPRRLFGGLTAIGRPGAPPARTGESHLSPEGRAGRPAELTSPEWHCASGLGGASDGPAPRRQSCAQRPAAAIGVIQMSPISASRRGTVTAIEAIVRQDDRHPSNAVTGGVDLPDASSGSGARVAPPVCERQRGRGGAHDPDRGEPAARRPTSRNGATSDVSLAPFGWRIIRAMQPSDARGETAECVGGCRNFGAVWRVYDTSGYGSRFRFV